MEVSFKNLIVGNGVFKVGTKIVTIKVPKEGLKEGTVLGKITTDSKFVISKKTSNDGSEKAVAILYKDIENNTTSEIEIKELVYVSGTFNSLGVIFGDGQTIQNTYDDLHKNSIEIIKGEM